MNNAEIKITLVNNDGSITEVKHAFEIDQDQSQSIEFEYIATADGGPILRPKNPRR